MGKRIRSCECGAWVSRFKSIGREGNARTVECPDCGHRYSLFSMGAPRSGALLLEDLGKPAPADAGLEGAESSGSGAADGAPPADTPPARAPGSESDHATREGSGPDREEHTTEEGVNIMTRSESRRSDEKVAQAPQAGAEIAQSEGARNSLRSTADQAVGRKIREFRKLRGLSQERLAKQIGLTFQQIQKFERGANRVTSGRLYQLAQALEVPVSAFFADLEEPGAGDNQVPELTNRQLDMIRWMEGLSETQADRVYKLLRAIAKADLGEAEEGAYGDTPQRVAGA